MILKKFTIWGNHSATQYPDVNFATIKGEKAKSVINDDKWITDTFIPAVQQRGAAIIAARGASSAASAASAAIDHMRDWTFGTHGKWTSMAILSDGSYGSTKGLYYSFPVIVDDKGKYTIVQGLTHSDFSKTKLQATDKELVSERDGVKDYLPK